MALEDIDLLSTAVKCWVVSTEVSTEVSFVALCLVAAVAGHSRYGIGGYGGGVLGGVHGGVLGGVHGGAIGGVHGGGVHGLGLVGSGIHGAGSFNTAHYPGPLPGYSFCDQRPVLGYNSCKYWSHYTSMYYYYQPYER
nr:shematrin-like protein 2 [Penaeus vannamei]